MCDVNLVTRAGKGLSTQGHVLPGHILAHWAANWDTWSGALVHSGITLGTLAHRGTWVGTLVHWGTHWCTRVHRGTHSDSGILKHTLRLSDTLGHTPGHPGTHSGTLVHTRAYCSFISVAPGFIWRSVPHPVLRYLSSLCSTIIRTAEGVTAAHLWWTALLLGSFFKEEECLESLCCVLM